MPVDVTGIYPVTSFAMTGIKQFLALVDAYAAATGHAESTISTKIFNDGKRIEKIRAGGDVGLRKVSDAISWFDAHWPEGERGRWPRNIPRPAPARAAEAS